MAILSYCIDKLIQFVKFGEKETTPDNNTYVNLYIDNDNFLSTVDSDRKN
jgi:hypothetical protein